VYGEIPAPKAEDSARRAVILAENLIQTKVGTPAKDQTDLRRLSRRAPQVEL
jgi:hypothetical protein